MCVKNSHFSPGVGWGRLPGRWDTCVRSRKTPASAPGGEGGKGSPHSVLHGQRPGDWKVCVWSASKALTIPHGFTTF